MKTSATSFNFRDKINFKFLSFRARLWIIVCIIGLIFTLDFITKQWAEETLLEAITTETNNTDNKDASLARRDLFYLKVANGEFVLHERHNIVVIPKHWRFIFVPNFDVGFSAFTVLDKWLPRETKSNIFKFVQLFAVLILLVYFIWKKLDFFLPFTLILSGGISNVVDRFIHGYVIDFIEWSLPAIPIRILNPWPVFNIADSSVTAGITLFVILFLFVEQTTSQVSK